MSTVSIQDHKMRPFVPDKPNYGQFVDTRIKRKDVIDGIANVAYMRNNFSAGRYDPIQRGTGTSFMHLPSEVRNMIYRYALDIGYKSKDKIRVMPRWTGRPTEFAIKDKNLLLASKQIYMEARTMMEAFDLAYVPVAGRTMYQQAIKGAAWDQRALTTEELTYYTALTTFINVHLHAHTDFLRVVAYDPEDQRAVVDTECAYLYGRMRQTLIIFIAASAEVVKRYSGIKRSATVHFDHFFSDWVHQVRPCGYNLKHVIRIMAEDVNTDWSFRYYVYTGDQKRESEHWPNWDEEVTKELDYIVGVCKPYANIKVVAEVYGDLKWSAEGVRSEVTRCVTPSSRVWPSWPDFVPWRLDAAEKE